MTSLFNPPGYQSVIPYMVVFLKPGRVPIVKQPLICLEPENKLRGGPVSPGVPQLEVPTSRRTGLHSDFEIPVGRVSKGSQVN